MNRLLARSLDELSILYMGMEQRNVLPKYGQKQLLQYFRKPHLKSPRHFYQLNGTKPDVWLNEVSSNTTRTLYEFSFDSPKKTPFPENNTATGRFYRLKKKKNAPAIIVLHGWRIKTPMSFFFENMCEQFTRLGFHSVFLHLPYHLGRTPEGHYSGELMVSADGIKTVEALHQAVLEVKMLFNFLEREGIKAVGLLGISLGAWLSSVLCTAEERTAFAVLVTPPANPERMFFESRLAGLIKEGIPNIDRVFRKFQKALNVVNPTLFKPVIPKDRILIVECTHDKFVPEDVVEELWEAWDYPPIKRYRHGHLSLHLFEPGFYEDVQEFVIKCLKE